MSNAPKVKTSPAKTKRDWFDKTHLGLSAVTFLAASAAAVFTGMMANDSSKTYDATNRAYIAITGVKWDGDPKVGFNQRFKILFKNVGKEPAATFRLIAFVSPDVFSFKLDAKDMPYVDPQSVRWPYMGGCEAWAPETKPVVGQRPVYTEVQNEAITYAFNDPPYLPQSIIDGTATFTVFGCATYHSLEKLRYSPFCFYFQPARGLPAKEGTFEWCPVGSGNAL